MEPNQTAQNNSVNSALVPLDNETLAVEDTQNLSAEYLSEMIEKIQRINHHWFDNLQNVPII